MARLGRGTPNRPIIVTGHPLGLPASPAAHAAKVVTQTARRGTGRAFIAHGLMAATIAASTHTVPHVHTRTSPHRPGVVQVHRSPSLANSTPQPHILSRGTRRAGRIIIWRTSGAVGIPAARTVRPVQVHPTTARRAGVVHIVTGRPGLFPATPQPHRIGGTTRRAGRTITVRAAAVPTVAAQAAPKPQIRTSSRRGLAGRIVVVHPRTVTAVPSARSRPALVRQTTARRAGRIVIVHGGPPGLASPKPTVVTSAARRAARIIIVGLRSTFRPTPPPVPGPTVGTVLSHTVLVLTVPPSPPVPIVIPAGPTILGPAQMIVNPPATPTPAPPAAPAGRTVLGPSQMVIRP